MTHAAFSPSGSAIGLNCPGGINLTRDLPDTSSIAAIRGTAQHQAVYDICHGKPMPKSLTVDGVEVVFDDDMIDAVNFCVEFAELIRANNAWFEMEQKLSLDWYFAPQPMPEPFFGTADVLAYDETANTATVLDWKFGAHLVHPTSPQLKSYAAMALGRFGSALPAFIRLCVVQPNGAGDPVRSVTIPVIELLDWMRDELIPALERVGSGDTTQRAGDWCKWCKLAGSCRELASLSMEIARVDFTDDFKLPEITGFSDEELGAILDRAEVIDLWIKQVRGEVSRRIDTGKSIAGWKLVDKRATRKWLDAAAAELSLAVMGDEIYTQPELRSPAQIEKIIKRHGLDVKMIEPLVSKESSGSTLVKASDQRPASTRIAAADYFND